MAVIGVGTVIGIVVLLRVSAVRPITTQFGFPGFQLPIAVVFGTAGAVILRRRPGNVIGALLLAEGVLSTLQLPIEWLPRLASVSGASQETIRWLAAPANVAWVPAVTIFGMLFALYPDGRAVSQRWGWVVPATIAGAAMAVVGLSVTPGPYFNYPDVQNPIGITALATLDYNIWYLVFLGPIALAGASLVVRWRGSTGVARAQLKWLAFVAVPFAVVGFAATVYPVASLVMIGLGALIPVAIAIAILRYRLYDIDELVSRTVVVGALTAILAGLYTAALKFFNELFLQVTGTESEGAIILATLVLAAAFTPVRKALEGIIERRLKKSVQEPGSPHEAALPAPGMDPGLLEAIVRRAVREELAGFAVVPAGLHGSATPTPRASRPRSAAGDPVEEARQA